MNGVRNVPVSGDGSYSAYPLPSNPYETDIQRRWFNQAKTVVAMQGASYVAAIELGADRIYKAEQEFMESATMPYNPSAAPNNKTLKEPSYPVTTDLLSLYPLVGPLSNGMVGIPRSELEWKDFHAPKGLMSSYAATPLEFKPESDYWEVGSPGLPDLAAIQYIHDQFLSDAPNIKKGLIFAKLAQNVSALQFPDVVTLVSKEEWNTLYSARRYSSQIVEAVFLQEMVSRMVSYATDMLQRDIGGMLASNSKIQAQAAAAFRMPVPTSVGQFRSATPYVAGDPRMSPINPTIYSTNAFMSSVDVSGKTVSNWGVLPPRTTAVDL